LPRIQNMKAEVSAIGVIQPFVASQYGSTNQ
jgi:hypothetical protein